MNKKTLTGIIFLLFTQVMIGQVLVDENGNPYLSSGQDLSEEYNVITTAVPFMTITPDSRAGGMGDVGAATTSDVWSQHWNASKYALAEKDVSFGISYTPWLEALGIKDIDLIYIAGYKKLDAQQAIGASLRYFSMGEIPAYDESGNKLNYDLSPKEYAIDLSYSRYLSDNFVMAMTGRYIYSNLGGEIDPEYKPGKAAAADISGTYFTELDLPIESDLQIGFNVSNIGNKVSYSLDQKDFIPTNLRIGAGLKMELDNHNGLNVYVDANKLLVPTPPLVVPFTNELGEPDTYTTGDDPNSLSPTQGIFKSFSDAPGGFKEEMKEIILNAGLEYWYDNQFAVRTGIFHESATKGNRKYFTLGAGLRLNVFGLDFAYLIPTGGSNSPLANTFRFSITFDFEGLATESKDIMTK